MERIVMRPIGNDLPVACWNCGRPVEVGQGRHAARYIYRGATPTMALVEDWIECACGAYQNVRRVNQITVEPLGTKPG